MQIKIFLIGLLIGSSYLIGDIIYRAYIKRHKELNDVIRILEIIRMDLAFGLYTLEEIFYRASLKNEYCLSSFFGNMHDDLFKEDGRPLEEILNHNIVDLKNKTNLQDKEIDEIKKLILTLGQSNVDSQERLIDLTCDNLKQLTNDSKDEILKKGALYKKLITAIGICIGIILI
ncbi:MAG: stage III sporulation protein AB [Terrisporobacter sp.]|uniref:stage III sporulation protein AB n=1 Tax=Terrisporobacter sp. TaxID=1965305 RepID=UPI002FC9EC55